MQDGFMWNQTNSFHCLIRCGSLISCDMSTCFLSCAKLSLAHPRPPFSVKPGPRLWPTMHSPLSKKVRFDGSFNVSGLAVRLNLLQTWKRYISGLSMKSYVSLAVLRGIAYTTCAMTPRLTEVERCLVKFILGGRVETRLEQTFSPSEDGGSYISLLTVCYSSCRPKTVSSSSEKAGDWPSFWFCLSYLAFWKYCVLVAFQKGC